MNAFFATVITVIAHTALWVWPFCVMLLFLGFQRTRNSTLPLQRMLILPIGVTALAILNFVLSWWNALAAVPAGLVFSGIAIWHLERKGATRRMPDHRFWLRGEWRHSACFC